MFADLREQLAAEQFVVVSWGQKTFLPQHHVITAPEIEMLIIHAEGAYDQFKRPGKNQANFVKQIFGCMM